MKDKDVPGGRYLVPGCWNRALYGDDADCHCPGTEKETTADLIQRLEDRIQKLEREIKTLKGQE